MRRKLVIGYDGSDKGKDALALGKLLAEGLEAGPRVVFVVDLPLGLMEGSKLREALDAASAKALEHDLDVLADRDAETTAVASDSPAGALHFEAEEEGAVAIVVGSTHRGHLGRVYPGSTTDSLLHGAPCAVAVAPEGYHTRAIARLSRIAVAFDGSEEASVALEIAEELAGRLDATLVVLTVAQAPPEAPAALAWAYTPDLYASYEEEEKRRILDRALSAAPDGLTVEGELLHGPPGDAISQASDAFDLLLIGSRGYGPLRRAFLGGVSAEVIHRARCPVLVLPRARTIEGLGPDRADDDAKARSRSTSE